MRSRRPSSEHAEAVTRRLAELSDQLAAARLPEEPAPAPEVVGGSWWDDHTRVALRPVERPVLSLVPGVPSAEPVDPPFPVVAEPTPERTPEPTQEPAPLPIPGRHASRRPLVATPEGLRGRIRLGGAQLTAVAVLVALGLAVTCWWVVRGDPEPPVPVAAPVGGEALVAPTTAEPAPGSSVPSLPGPGPSPGPAPGAAGATVTVDVAGRVRRPGIVVLDAGSRVVDALAEAGGARPRVDTTSLNLARVLVDGEQLLVGHQGAAAVAPGVAVPPSAGGAPAPAALVDLNLADQTLLETLPQVGPVTATAIIAWRTEHGAFTSVTELLEVDGIGEATLAQLTPLVTV